MKQLTVSILILLMFSCDKDDTNPINNENEFKTDTIEIVQDQNSPTITKGFYGNILEWKGDFMPGMDSNDMGSIQPVQMNLYVYHKLTFDSVENARTKPYSLFWYVDSVKQVPIAIIKSNNKGFYQIELNIGSYTGLVKIDDTVFYNNGGTSDGHIGAMIIESDTLIKRNFNIDYEITQ